MSMLTLTSKTCFGVMCGCKNKYGIRARLTSCLMVPMGSSGSLRAVDCNIPHRRVKNWGRAVYEHAHLD
jgi:hypothetical protein